MRELYSSESSYEWSLGYSRAGRVDDTLDVSVRLPAVPMARSSEASVNADPIHLGKYRSRVDESRLYVTDISQWQEAWRAPGEVFGDIRPALTLLHVLPFVDPGILIEVEITASCIKAA